MKMSEAGLRALETEEGFQNWAYPDPKWRWAVPTIGVGHTGPEVHQGLYWDDATVLAVFAKDVEPRESSINAHVTAPLVQGQYDALGSFIFNVGTGAFENSTLLRKLNDCDYAAASAEFPKWCIPDILVARRARERSMFDGNSTVVLVAHATTADVQRALGISDDGIYGPQTHAAVLNFQQAHGLTVDGIVGPRTLAALGLL